MKKNSSTINKNEIEKTKRKIKIKISHIATRVIYLVMFNKFLYQNKFVIEKHIKFVIETNTQIKFIEQYKYIKQCKAAYMKNLIKKLILKKIYIKLRKNHR